MSHNNEPPPFAITATEVVAFSWRNMKRGIGFLYCCLVNSPLAGKPFAFKPLATATSSHNLLITRNMASSSSEEATNNGDKSWRSLLEVSVAKSRKIRGSNYVQISTVDEKGEPRCRTVVFRGFQKVPENHAHSNLCDDLTCLMKMCTDKRSKKVAENAKQNIAEVVWWFPKSSEQYRIRGPLVFVGGDEMNDDRSLEIARKELWGNISDPARESFFGQVVPGEAYEKDTSSIPPGGRDENGKVLPPPENFLLMMLDPTDCDYLRLTGSQYRQMDTRSPSGWSSKRVNP